MSYSVGSGGVSTGVGHSGSDTYFCNSSSNCASISGTAVVVGAKGGASGANGGGCTGGAGGAASSAVGGTGGGTTNPGAPYAYSGGNGGSAACSNVGGNGGGGGGAAGLNGAGNAGTTGQSSGAGGAGDAGNGGSAGSNGTEWDASHGSGGGGNGATSATSHAGGSYGGAGGGAIANNTGGSGKPGIIVITYTPVPVPFAHTTITLSAITTITGNAYVLGTLSKGSGSFVIDHPLDPKNKLLYHSFVESPDAMNIYDGIVTLNKKREATVSLPDYFFALNKDFQYLLTAVGQPMPNLHIAKEAHRWFLGWFGTPVFDISGGAPGGKVSWQVTGVRHDPYIRDNPIVPEVEKGPDQLVHKGEYLCPECYAQ